MDELKLSFTRSGSPQGRPLCLIHGWGLDSSFLTPIADMFPERDVRLIDLPGYGRSRNLKDEIKDFGGTVQALYNTIPPGADVMAVSLGAIYAIKALTAFPQSRAASLVTICSTARFPQDPNWPGLSAALFYKCSTLLTPRRCARVLHLFIKMQTTHRQEHDEKFLHHHLAACTPPDYETLQRGICLAGFADARADLEHLQIPCLQLFGARDRLVPASPYVLGPDKLRRFYIFANSAHNPYLTEPQLFEQVVREFFDRVHSSDG